MSFIAISICIDINMTDAIEVRQHRHFTLRRNALDQPFATARHHHVDIGRHGEQRPHRRTIHHWHHLSRLHW